MKVAKLYAGLFGCLLGAGWLAGCTVEAGVTPAPPTPEVTGSVTVVWTIAGRSDAAVCSEYSVDSLELVVYDNSGSPVIRTTAPCEAFNVSIDLAPGLYDADATLVDVNQKRRSRTLPIQDIRVTAGTNISVDIDFPAGSLL